ncbi:hypothetical protein Salat_1923900 [Sesamum alatum]|uniref:Uncharacterized protein n=1 Tax=Sesamum alatum TaxID=300844 RepID=A0AAE2CIH2_9LAMI|nr:hypothetical protein Salat_1923900 [Sesamum alatum]
MRKGEEVKEYLERTGETKVQCVRRKKECYESWLEMLKEKLQPTHRREEYKEGEREEGYEGPHRDDFAQRRAMMDLTGITSQIKGLVLRPRTDSGQSTADPTRSPKIRENPTKIKQKISYEAFAQRKARRDLAGMASHREELRGISWE